MVQRSQRQRFSLNLAILGLGELLTRLLTFVAFVHLARVLTPEWFGLVEVALAVLMVAMLVVDQGFPTYGTRELARDPACANLLVPRLVSIQLVLALVTYAALAAIVVALPLTEKLTSLILGLGLSLLGVPFMLLWVFQGRKQMFWVTAPQVVRQLVFAGVVLLMIQGPEHLLRLPYAEIAAVAVSALMFVAVYRAGGGRLSPSLRISGCRALFAEALPIGGAQLIWVLRMYLPIILLATLVEQSVVGRFGAAHRLMMVVQTLVGVYFVNLFPTMSETAQESSKALVHLLHRSLSLVTWPVAAGALATTMGAAPLIGLVFGDSYMQPDSISVLAVLIWIIPILVWRRHLRSALITLDQQRTDFLCSLAGIALLAVLLPVLTIMQGAVGTAWAMVVSEALAVGWTFLCLRRRVPNLSVIRSLVTFRGAGKNAAPVRSGS